MADPIKIGDILHVRWPRGDWHELRITGKTSQSWLAEYIGEPDREEDVKILRKDLTFRPWYSHDRRYQTYVLADKLALVAREHETHALTQMAKEIAWKISNAPLIPDEVAHKIREIACIFGIKES